MQRRHLLIHLIVLAGLLAGLAACGGPPPGGDPTRVTPQGRIAEVNQGANTMSVIDVATDTVFANVPTGNAPHQVVASPDGRELWVTLYQDNHLQILTRPR